MKAFKRMMTRVLSLCLVLTLTLSMAPTASAKISLSGALGKLVSAVSTAVKSSSSGSKNSSSGTKNSSSSSSSSKSTTYTSSSTGKTYTSTTSSSRNGNTGYNQNGTGKEGNRKASSYDNKKDLNSAGSKKAYDSLPPNMSWQNVLDGGTWKDKSGNVYGWDKQKGYVQLSDNSHSSSSSSSSSSSYRPSYTPSYSGSYDPDPWTPTPPPSYPDYTPIRNPDPPTPTPTPKPVHTHTYTTTCTPLNATQHQTKTYCTGCGSVSSSTNANHNFSYTYKDISDSQHQVTAKCSTCGYSTTYNEAHKETTSGKEWKCSVCGHSFGALITWHYYDEHTSVTHVEKQRWGSGLVIPPARGRQDYKFTGWYTEWGGIGTQPTAGQKVNKGCITDYYASWKAILVYDIDAPIITVTRNPASIDTPTKGISLTITAKDLPHPETGETHDHPLPLQIEGETEWHASPYTINVTENKPIMIVARDSKGNTREFLVDIDNLDVSAPIINGFTQDTTGWTNKPVTLRIDAEDDQALHAQPFRWEFTPNSSGTAVVGQWTATSTYAVTEAGKVRVQVRDAVGNAVWSDYYYVNNVDTTAPSLDPNQPYTVSTTATVAASTGVTITLNLWDTPDSTSGMSSGLAAAPIKWVSIDNIFSTARTVTVHTNGTYNVVLRDAVGNESAPIPITISNISTSEPVINSITATDVDGDVINPLLPGPGDKAPITLTVSASFGDAGEPEKPYSYDGGLTWTSLPHTTVNGNGEYTVTIRDANGTQKTESIILNTVDSADPIVGMYLFKGIPDDWVDRFGSTPCTERDYVWKLRVDASDVGGSGIQSVYCQWDGVTLTPDQLPRTFDVKNPGTYQVTVTDNAGHEVQAEKVVQWTDLGESVFGPNPEVPVTTPDVGGGNEWDSGSAGKPFNANLEDLVFGPTGAYNTSTGTFTPYPAGMEGIPVHFNAGITRNKWGTATVSFNNKEYRATWLPADVTGDTVTRQEYDGKANAKVLGTGNPIPGYAFIPIGDITGDMKNARIRVTVREWNDEACTDLNKEGTENFYTSVQNSKPTITYTYNRGSDEMTVIATSALSGIQTVTWQFDSGTENTYTGPFPLGTTPPTTITLKAKDNLGIETTLNIDVANLGLLGNTTGMPATGTLSTDAISNGTSASHSSNRAADIFIIGGTRGNTETVPGANVFDQALAG